jgi:hypothetical protein
MMPIEINAIVNSSDLLSGTARSQTTKDGSFVGLGQFADDPETRQKIFLSLLSQLGSGTLRVASEESKNINPKPEAGRLTDEGNRKPKEKQGKGGNTVKRVTSVYPETPVIVMGLMSFPDLPQSDPLPNPAFPASCVESEQEIVSDVSIDEPLAGESIPQEGKFSVSPVHAGSGQNSAVQFEAAQKIQGKGNPGMKKISGTDLSRISRVLADSLEEKTKHPRQRFEPSASLEPVLSETRAVQAVAFKMPQMFSDGRQPEAEIISDSNKSDMRRVQVAPVEGTLLDLVQVSEAVSTLAPIPSGIKVVQDVAFKETRMFPGDWQSYMKTVSDSEPSSISWAHVTPADGAAKEPEQAPVALSTSVQVPSAIELDRFSRVKAAQTFPVQPDEATDPETYFSCMGRDQAFPVKDSPKLFRQQRRDPLPVPDSVSLNPLEENISMVKGDQVQRFSTVIISKGASVREKVPADQKGDPDRPHSIKVNSASFVSVKGAAETGATTPTSAGASNADGNNMPDMFIAASHSERIASNPEDAHFNAQDSESKVPAVNFTGEGQVEKASGINPLPMESRLGGPSFQTEVLNLIVEKTSTNLKSGKSEIRIDLKPEALGYLRLHVSIDHQQVTVKILAENPLVKEMIENQAALIKNELQQQGIHVNTVKVDTLMSGGSDFAYSQHEGAPSRQARHEPAYGSGRDSVRDCVSKEPDSSYQANNRGGSLVNYFA